ncbi:hypothetical protein RCL1_006616 [Eukaryota sp. TZLM3-RCL]
MTSSSVADYLKCTVSDTLSDGIVATMLANPADPIDFLGNWLLSRPCIQSQLQSHLDFQQQVKHEKDAFVARLKFEEEQRLLKQEQERLRLVQEHLDAHRFACTSSLSDVLSLDQTLTFQLLAVEDAPVDAFRILRCVLYLSEFTPKSIPPSWNVSKVLLTSSVLDSLQTTIDTIAPLYLVKRLEFVMTKLEQDREELKDESMLLFNLLIFIENWIKYQNLLTRDEEQTLKTDEQFDIEEVVENENIEKEVSEQEEEEREEEENDE